MRAGRPLPRGRGGMGDRPLAPRYRRPEVDGRGGRHAPRRSARKRAPCCGPVCSSSRRTRLLGDRLRLVEEGDLLPSLAAAEAAAEEVGPQQPQPRLRATTGRSPAHAGSRRSRRRSPRARPRRRSRLRRAARSARRPPRSPPTASGGATTVATTAAARRDSPSRPTYQPRGRASMTPEPFAYPPARCRGPWPSMGTPVLFYDGGCGLCHGAVRLLLRLDAAGRLRFAPLGGETFAALVPAGPARGCPTASCCGRPTAGMLLRSRAVVAALRLAGGRAAWLGRALSLLPAPLADRLYDAVARGRRRLFAVAARRLSRAAGPLARPVPPVSPGRPRAASQAARRFSTTIVASSSQGRAVAPARRGVEQRVEDRLRALVLPLAHDRAQPVGAEELPARVAPLEDAVRAHHEHLLGPQPREPAAEAGLGQGADHRPADAQLDVAGQLRPRVAEEQDRRLVAGVHVDEVAVRARARRRRR